MIMDFYNITDSGELLKPDWWKQNIGHNAAVVKTVIGFQWRSSNGLICRKYSYPVTAKILLDLDGVILTERSSSSSMLHDSLVVYNADGSERFRIKPSSVSSRSDPSRAFFYYASYRKFGGWECRFNDGHDEYLADLNIKTGELGDIVRTRV